MKKLIQKLANSCGYSISRLSSTEDAFSAMRHLLVKINEPIIFDVGAHHGHVSRKFREMFPDSSLYAFEPFEDSFEQLRSNTMYDSKVSVFNFGLSDQNGTLPFHSNSSSATNSLLPSDKAGAQTWGGGLLETQNLVEAQFKTLDSFINSTRIPEIDILKIDVQGAEQQVIEGAAAACRRGIIRLIYSEIIAQPTYKGQKRFDEALATFYNAGFDLYNIYNMSFTNEGKLRQVDAIFTKANKKLSKNKTQNKI